MPPANPGRNSADLPLTTTVVGVGAVAVLAWTQGIAPLWTLAICATVAASHWLLCLQSRFRERGQRRAMTALAERLADADSRRHFLEPAYDRVRSVLESVSEAVLIVDDAGNVMLANPAAMRLFRWAGPAAHGVGLQEVLDGELGARATQAWKALKLPPSAPREGGNHQIKLVEIAHRGRVFDLVAARVVPSRTEHDSGALLVITDVTRHHEIARMKNEFLSGISHELRTPLTNICAYSEILLQAEPGTDGEWPEFLQIIQSQGQHLTRLVESFLEYVRIESGEAEFEFEPLDLGELVTSVVDLFRAAAEDKSIEVRVAVETSPRPVDADRLRITQVVSSLLDNAVKFTPDNGRILVSLTEQSDHVRLSVGDSGPGIEVDLRELAFDKFAQLRDHLTDKPRGTGLGLATCRAIVHRAGGFIWCDTSPSLGGADFQLILPVNQPAPVACT